MVVAATGTTSVQSFVRVDLLTAEVSGRAGTPGDRVQSAVVVDALGTRLDGRCRHHEALGLGRFQFLLHVERLEVLSCCEIATVEEAPSGMDLAILVREAVAAGPCCS